MLTGTLAVTAGAVLLATPLALASAVFGRFYVRGVLSRVHRRVLETLAGVPSVVFGLWGLMVLVPAIARIRPPGQSVLAGMLGLALMIHREHRPRDGLRDRGASLGALRERTGAPPDAPPARPYPSSRSRAAVQAWPRGLALMPPGGF